MSDRSLGSHQSSRMKNDEWLTPIHIVASCGVFDLDPCAPEVRPWPTAKHHFTKKDDGLAQPWFGRVWMNPPFGAQVGIWLAKLKAHGNGIALVAARTETRRWFDHIWNDATAILFLKTPRPHFHYVDGSRAKDNSGAPIALIAYGLPNAEALRQSRLPGAFVPLHPLVMASLLMAPTRRAAC